MEARGAGLRETMAHLDAGALTPEQFAVERQERLLISPPAGGEWHVGNALAQVKVLEESSWRRRQLTPGACRRRRSLLVGVQAGSGAGGAAW